MTSSLEAAGGKMLADLVMGDGPSNRPSRQLSTAETDTQSQEGLTRQGMAKLEHEQVSMPAGGVDYWLQGSFRAVVCALSRVPAFTAHARWSGR